MFKKRISYKEVIVFILSTLCSYLLFYAFNGYGFLSVSFYVSILYLGFNAFLGAFSFCLSILFVNNFTFFLSSIITVIISTLIFSIYKKQGKSPKSELIFYCLLFSLPFLLLSNMVLDVKIISFVVSIIAVFVFISSSRVLFIKKLDFKLSGDEKLCFSVFIILIELGFLNVFSYNLLKSVNLFLILAFITILKGSRALPISIILSIPPSIFSHSLIPLSIYAILCAVSSIFINHSKILSCFSLIITDLLFMVFTDLYGSFYYYDVFYTILPVCIYLFTPNAFFSELNHKISAYQNKNLSKHSINRIRRSISGKLFLISDVFNEMHQSFSTLKYMVSSNDDLIYKMADEVIINVCEKCPSYNKCKRNSIFLRGEIIKILSVGVAKNRVSLIDLTKHFTESCGFVNGVICEMNSLITKYRQKVKQSDEILSGKELLQMQSKGVSDVLKDLALNYSKRLEFGGELEKTVSNALYKKGIIFNELMTFGDINNLEINVIIDNKFIKNGGLLQAINEVLKEEYSIVSKTGISYTTSLLTIKKSPNVDAAFGLAYKTKNSKSDSGDTHSLLKIDEGKFLIALSDGMGSGNVAKTTSTTAISLIESFYKAGLDSNLILSMVNKVLTINTDDSFSAMDVLSVNLFNLTADFIKIGAPYSFILSDNSVKIVEGSSLPLGILDDLSPNSCSFKLEDGCCVIMLTDGVSDAFSSSTDMIEFLKTLDNKNPQFVADSILNHALKLENDIPKDDMTVLCVRVFKKVA